MTTLRDLAIGPDSWRFPALALALEAGDVGEIDLRRIVSEDMARSLSPSAAVGLLLEAYAFETAERMVSLIDSQSLVDEEWVNSELELIEDRQREARDAFNRRCRAILALCKRIGVDAPRDLDDLEVLLPSGPVLFEQLRGIEEEVAAAEARRRAEVQQRLVAAALDDSSPRRAEVFDLLEDGELRLAEMALDRPVSDDRYERPRLNPRAWPRRTSTLDGILFGFGDSELRDPVIAPFVPPVEDVAGWGLIEALRAVARGDPDATVRYVRAVQALVGRPTDPYVETREGVTYAELEIEDDQRLPRLVFNANRLTMHFAVGLDAGDANLRLSLKVSDRTSNHVTIDIAAILELLSKAPSGAVRDRSDRRILLLRALCSQLPVPAVVDERSFGPAEEVSRLRGRTCWFFYLMGYLVDARQVNAFLELTSGRGALMVAIANLAVTAARRQASAIALEEIRSDEATPGALLAAIDQDLSDPQASIVLLCFLRFRPSDTTSLTTGLQNMLGESELNAPAGLVFDIVSATTQLVEKGYLQQSPSGDLEFGSVGGLGLITQSQAAAHAPRHLITVIRDFHADLDRTISTRILLDVQEIVAHAAKGLALISAAGRTPDTVNISRSCRLAASLAGQRTPGAVIDVDIDDKLANFELQMDPQMFVAMVWNLLNNATEAVRDDRPAVLLTATEHPTEVVIANNDNGPGFDATAAAAVNRGERIGSTKHPGRASGLMTAQSAGRNAGVTFTVVAGRSGLLNGGMVRLVLPR